MNLRRDARVLRTGMRTGMTVTAAVAGLAVLTACGGPVRMGSAAIIGSHSVSATTLGNEVTNLNRAYHASGGRIRLQFPPSQTPQAVLSWLVRFRVREQLATRAGVSVTPGASQRALAAARAQARQSSASLDNLAVANGLPPDMLTKLGRYQAIETAVLRQLDGGTLPTSNSALQALGKQFNREQCLAAKSLRIQINPQFGRMDYTQLSVVPAASTLSAPQLVKSSPKPPTGSSPQC